MCDYSLMHVSSRSAKTGEKLVTRNRPRGSGKWPVVAYQSGI